MWNPDHYITQAKALLEEATGILNEAKDGTYVDPKIQLWHRDMIAGLGSADDEVAALIAESVHGLQLPDENSPAYSFRWRSEATGEGNEAVEKQIAYIYTLLAQVGNAYAALMDALNRGHVERAVKQHDFFIELLFAFVTLENTMTRKMIKPAPPQREPGPDEEWVEVNTPMGKYKVIRKKKLVDPEVEPILNAKVGDVIVRDFLAALKY